MKSRAVWGALAGIFLVGVAFVGVALSHRPTSSLPLKNNSSPKDLEQVTGEIKKKLDREHRSQESLWADEGRLDKVLNVYPSWKNSGAAKNEERAKILRVLARAARPRAQWPSALNDTQVNDVIDFLVKEMKGAPARVGGEAVAAHSMQALAEWASAVPRLQPQAEAAIFEFYSASAKRPGVQGGCLQSLARIRSPKGIQLSTQVALGEDAALGRAGVYALSEYVAGTDKPLSAKASESLVLIAQKKRSLRPLSVKILAFRGDRKIASTVPDLLENPANPADVEAAAFAIERLKLKEYRALLMKKNDGSYPFLAKQIQSAIDATE